MVLHLTFNKIRIQSKSLPIHWSYIEEKSTVALLSDEFIIIYMVGWLGTFIYLTFFDNYIYTSWNWIIVLPINIFLSGIWPIYWGILNWVLG